MFDVTSIRKGFAGGGFDGGQACRSRWRWPPAFPGAELIPDGAELFLGFTSTQSQGLGPRKIVNFETLGYVDLRSGYFREGTHMHLSHIGEQLDTWYQLFDFDDRVDTAFRPGFDVREGTQTVPQAPEDVVDRAQIARGLPDASDRSVTAPRSRRRRACRRITSRATAPSTRRAPRFRTAPTSTRSTTRSSGALDPSATSSAAARRPESTSSSSIRRATTSSACGWRWTASFPAAHAEVRRRATQGQGFNSVLETTHRQNFLVPPRRHRAFPLAELSA